MSAPLPYRLAAFDLDGTLLTSDKRLTERTVKILTRAAEAGVVPVPATGRFYGGMPQAVRDLPFLRYAITINGALVTDCRTDAALYRAELPLAEALEILAFLDPLPVIYDCFQDNWGWMTRSLQARAADFAPDAHYLKMLRELRTPVEELKAHLAQKGRDVQKVQLFTRDLSLRERLLEELPARFAGIAVSSSVYNNLEINAARANKGDALLALAAALDIPPAQTLAFGDGLNDLPMLRAAGLGVAMANAAPEVRAAAGLFAASNDADGAALALERLIF